MFAGRVSLGFLPIFVLIAASAILQTITLFQPTDIPRQGRLEHLGKLAFRIPVGWEEQKRSPTIREFAPESTGTGEQAALSLRLMTRDPLSEKERERWFEEYIQADQEGTQVVRRSRSHRTRCAGGQEGITRCIERDSASGKRESVRYLLFTTGDGSWLLTFITPREAAGEYNKDFNRFLESLTPGREGVITAAIAP